MLFRDVKQGYPVYMFNRKDVDVKVGKVTNSPLPHFDPKTGTAKMVVDLNIEIDGNVMSYVFDDTCEVGYYNDMVISMNKDSILREIERVKSQSEEALKMVDYHKEAVAKCNQLMKDYSPEFRERTEATERMNALEGKVDKLTDTLAKLIGKFDKERREL